ncbi:MAG: GT2 family glycosyltransferase [Yoonia sp.]|jgi:GT2 family glycosyltransferase
MTDQQDEATQAFDVFFYKEYYQDLVRSGLSNLDDFRNHYTKRGAQEKRLGSVDMWLAASDLPADLLQGIEDWKAVLERIKNKHPDVTLRDLLESLNDPDRPAYSIFEDPERTGALYSQLAEHFLSQKQYEKVNGFQAKASTFSKMGATADNLLVAIDSVFAIGGVGVFIRGWTLGIGSGKREIQLTLNDVEKGEILETAFRFPRQDLAGAFHGKFKDQAEHAGFVVFIDASETHFSQNTIVLTSLYDGQFVQAHNPVATVLQPNQAAAIELLKFPFVNLKGMTDYIGKHLAPAISQLSVTRSDDILAEDIHYGSAPETPRLSIIVPLYGRFDFMETQLALFADDPQFMTDIELIYVVDDPRLERGIRISAVLYEQLFGVPFKVLYYDKNLGYAGANNVGVRAARAEHILLLNSDVFPAAPGWCDQMLDRFASLPDCGALGTRLLFADGSLQHDGMIHVQASFLDDLYICDHPGKGGPAMPVDPETSTVEVAATTGACFLMKRSDYEAIGGFDEGFLIGDFEDSDLCLALTERGAKIYVARDIVLYHLERQSQSIVSDSGDWKHQLTIYNCWRHQNKWIHLLNATKEQA